MTIDTVSWTVTAPGAAGAAGVPVAGDSAQVRSTPEIIGGRLVGLWTFSQAVGFTQLTFPYGHDMQRNIRYRHVALNGINQIPQGMPQPMKSQDLLTVLQAGSAVAGDVELVHALIAYPDLPGGSDKFIGFDEAQQRIEEMVTIEDTVTATVASTYSGARAFNQVTTALKANRDYAVLGIYGAVPGGALTIRGQDTGNLRVGAPCNLNTIDQGANYFARLSAWHALPLIPVINAANQANTFVELVQNENLVAVPFTVTLGLLAEK